MPGIRSMTDAELAAEWLACEQYINDSDPDDPDSLRRAVSKQLAIEREQCVRDALSPDDYEGYGLGYMQNRVAS